MLGLQIPPSALPGISPSRGEINSRPTSRGMPRPFVRELNFIGRARRRHDSISPLEGEMAGRPEGGNARSPRRAHAH